MQRNTLENQTDTAKTQTTSVAIPRSPRKEVSWKLLLRIWSPLKLNNENGNKREKDWIQMKMKVFIWAAFQERLEEVGHHAFQLKRIFLFEALKHLREYKARCLITKEGQTRVKTVPVHHLRSLRRETIQWSARVHCGGSCSGECTSLLHGPWAVSSRVTGHTRVSDWVVGTLSPRKRDSLWFDLTRYGMCQPLPGKRAKGQRPITRLRAWFEPANFFGAIGAQIWSIIRVDTLLNSSTTQLVYSLFKTWLSINFLAWTRLDDHRFIAELEFYKLEY